MVKTVISKAKIAEMLKKIASVRVGLLGDVCLDLYWLADMRKSVLSRETPHYPLPIVEERRSPGGAGNAAACARALNPAALRVVSVIGNDWRGALLENCFAEMDINVDYIIKSGDRVTPAYCKPLRRGISSVVYEDPRLDFENYAVLSEKDEKELIDRLDAVIESVDVLAVSDQLHFGCVTPKIRKRLGELSGKLPVVADSRERAGEFGGVIIKANELEAAAAAGIDPVSPASPENYERIAKSLSEKNKKPCAVTLGENGSLWADDSGVYYAEGVKVPPPVDIVGAGDAFLAALCCSLGAGIAGGEAVAFANLAAAVTVRKIGTTGTARPDEILDLYDEVYHD